jgi:Tfp pilus assembly protein FimV
MNLELIVAGLIVIVVVAVIAKKVRLKTTAPDFDDEDALLEEIEIYEAYGRTRQAIDLLQQAVREKPENELYRRKLAALKQADA